MSFSVRLSPDQVSVEAGATLPVAVVVANKGDAPEHFEIQVEGIDGEWVAVPEPSFVAEAGEDRTERVFFKPARVPENTAGNYPFVIRVRSLDSGEARTASGVLEIKAFNNISLEVSPKKGIHTTTKPHSDFAVTVMNLGNTEHTVQMFGSDPDDECGFDFEQEVFTLGPGQSRTLRMTVQPKTKKVIAGTRLYGFAVSARSTHQPNVAASAQAQLEQRPLLTPGVLAFLAFALLMLAAWFALTPKPPVVSLTVMPPQVLQGESIHITWQARESTRVRLVINGAVIGEDLPVQGEYDYKTMSADPVVVAATPYKDAKPGAPKTQTVTVTVPPQAPDPEIVQFEARDRQVTLGESVFLKYKFNSAVTKAILAPSQQPLDLNIAEIEVKPGDVGTIEYKILAYNATGKVVSSRPIRVTVNPKIDVVITSFEVSPLEVGPGEPVTVTWNVSKAAKVTIFVGDKSAIVPSQGSEMVTITENTTIKLIASDDANHSVARTHVVKVKQPDPTPDPTGFPTSTPDTGGGPGH